jgi:hypothetical protein
VSDILCAEGRRIYKTADSRIVSKQGRQLGALI